MQNRQKGNSKNKLSKVKIEQMSYNLKCCRSNNSNQLRVTDYNMKYNWICLTRIKFGESVKRKELLSVKTKKIRKRSAYLPKDIYFPIFTRTDDF